MKNRTVNTISTRLCNRDTERYIFVVVGEDNSGGKRVVFSHDIINEEKRRVYNVDVMLPVDRNMLKVNSYIVDMSGREKIAVSKDYYVLGKPFVNLHMDIIFDNQEQQECFKT